MRLSRCLLSPRHAPVCLCCSLPWILLPFEARQEAKKLITTDDGLRRSPEAAVAAAGLLFMAHIRMHRAAGLFSAWWRFQRINRPDRCCFVLDRWDAGKLEGGSIDPHEISSMFPFPLGG